ncbi:hypothetical protein ACFLY5_00260 [Patescibacteria group bacterium]
MGILKKSVYISSSWKNRKKVRNLAVELRKFGFNVYDFTDRECRTEEEIPPEKFPEQFDPEVDNYWHYLNSREEWKNSVIGNKKALDTCDIVILLLPCGIDATADWAYAVGRGKTTYIIGHPPKGERSPTHLWAEWWFPNVNTLLKILHASKHANDIFS